MSIKQVFGAIVCFLTIYGILSALYIYLQFLWGNITLAQAIHDLVMLAIPTEVKILMAFPSIIGVIVVMILVFGKSELTS